MKMGKFKVGIKFDIKLLNTLKDNNNSGVEMHNTNHHLALHPINLNNFNKSIKDVLNAGIAKYNKNLEGILLGYQNIKLPADIGLINYDSCYIHMNIEADFFIFKPEIGKEMQGVVNRKSKDHVGVLVYNVFNVSIPKPQTDEDWLGHSVNIGDEILFRITFISFSSCLPYIRGDLISIISKIEVKELNLNHSRKKLNKKIIFEDEPSSDETPVLKKTKKEKKYVAESPESKYHKKRKRNNTSDEESSANETLKKLKREESCIIEASKHNHNKKKRKFDESKSEEDPIFEEIAVPKKSKKGKVHIRESSEEEHNTSEENDIKGSKKKHRRKSTFEEGSSLDEKTMLKKIKKEKKHLAELTEEEYYVSQENNLNSNKKKRKDKIIFEEEPSPEGRILFKKVKKEKIHVEPEDKSEDESNISGEKHLKNNKKKHNESIIFENEPRLDETPVFKKIKKEKHRG